MNVRGTYITTHNVQVCVATRDVFSTLEQELRSKFNPPGEYINEVGKWETWDDTGHGSGTTRRYREATAEEITVFGALETLRKRLS